MNYTHVDIACRHAASLGEGPTWDKSRNGLWWVDIERSRLLFFAPEGATCRDYRAPSMTSCVVTTSSGQLLLAAGMDIIRCVPENGQMITVATTDANIASCRLNDGKCDPYGRFCVGSLSLLEENVGRGTLYLFDARRGVRKVLENVTCSNGMAWSRSARTMYFIDSALGTIDSLDYDAESGMAENRRTTFVVPSSWGIPDGMTIDEEDNLWVGIWGGGSVICIDPGRRKMIGRLVLPTRHVTSCAFGGPSLRQLYITTAQFGLSEAEQVEQPEAGFLFVAEPGASGLPAAVFNDAGE